jgi:transcription elongation GreA/GreB family factor
MLSQMIDRGENSDQIGMGNVVALHNESEETVMEAKIINIINSLRKLSHVAW